MLDVRQLLHQPFWLATLGLYLAAWVLATVGTATATTDAFSYWVIVFAIILFLFTLYSVLSRTLVNARIALCALNALNAVYTSRYADQAVGLSAQGAGEIVAAIGYVIMTVVGVLWILALGIEPSPFVGAGVRKSVSSASVSRTVVPGMRQSAVSRVAMTTAVPGTTTTKISSSSLGSTSGAAAAATPAVTEVRLGTADSASAVGSTPPSQQQPVTVMVDRRSIPTESADVDVGTDVEYRHKGIAQYAYTASADDPNELSFNKGEVLEVVDTNGRWWQARKSDGSIGIVPSNYIKIEG